MQEVQSQVNGVDREKGIAELKVQGEIDRTDFRLQLAGVRNVKAARAILADHDNDIDKLKETEPWLFESDGKHAAKGSIGTTGLPDAGAMIDSDKQLRIREELRGCHRRGVPEGGSLLYAAKRLVFRDREVNIENHVTGGCENVPKDPHRPGGKNHGFSDARPIRG